jgi:hypothetical protein
MSSGFMSRNVRPSTPASQEAQNDPTIPFRDRIAERNSEYVTAYPRAAELESRVLKALHDALNGSAVHLRGLHSPQRFRDAIVGLKNFPLSDLCRLGSDPSREARAAVRAVAQVLASAVGMTLVPLEGAVVNAHEAMASVVETHAALTAELSRGLADGKLTREEAMGLRPELEAHKAKLAQLEGVVADAEQAK